MAVSSSKRLSTRRLDTSQAEPMQILIAEHRITEQALNCLERMAERWTGPGHGESLDGRAIRAMLDFFQTFVEEWHFRREEAYFAASGVQMESLEIHDGGDCTFHDHQRSSKHLRGIEEAVETIAARTAEAPSASTNSRRRVASGPSGELIAAYRKFGEHARAYSDILLRHIENEEDFIYPFLERRLTPAGKQAAAAAFRRTSEEATDVERLEACLAVAESLAERFRVSAGSCG